MASIHDRDKRWWLRRRTLIDQREKLMSNPKMVSASTKVENILVAEGSMRYVTEICCNHNRIYRLNLC